MGEERVAWFSPQHVRKDRTLCASTGSFMLNSALLTRGSVWFWFHFGFWTHTLNVQHLYGITFSPAVSRFGGFKQLFPASVRRDTQTKTMPRFLRACTSPADAKQICFSGIQLTLNKSSRVETKCLFFPEEDSLPTSIKNRQLALKPSQNPVELPLCRHTLTDSFHQACLTRLREDVFSVGVVMFSLRLILF